MEKQKSKEIKKITPLNIVGIILIIIFLPIIIINMVIVIKGAIHPEKVPMVFNTAPLVVISDSMTIDKEKNTGAFNKNDLIIVKKVDPSILKEGDIITYMAKDGEVITHRIIDVIINEDGSTVFETKGDASPGIDINKVTYEQVVGIYKNRIPKLGGFATFLQKPTGIIIVLGVPLLIFFGVDIILKNKEKNSANSKTAELEAELARLKSERAQGESVENTDSK